jgi:uncharacterized protein (UPF0276 family)
VDDFLPPPPLGVGFTYHPGMQLAKEVGSDCIDFFEISPDVLCHERVQYGRRVLDYHPTLLAEALRACAHHPIVVHGLSLSIGSASGWNEGYLHILDELYRQRPFAWHSEHLGFLLTTYPDGRPLHTGVPLPVPYTEEAVDLIAPRAATLGQRYQAPFLLENLTYYLPGLLADGGRDEIAFLNDLTERSGCGLLLDLYNLYCNAINFGFDPCEALGRLRLDRVVEIHLAGGASHEGFMMDVHSTVVPEPVWDLLDWLIPRAPHVAGIVYELMEQALPLVGLEGVCQQLERARAVWKTCCTVHGRGGAYAAP